VSPRRAVAVALVLGAVVTTVVLLRSGGEGNPTVARVAGEPITREQLDAVVEHFRLEAKGEGKPFPGERSAAFQRLRNRLLGLLVYRTELRQTADRLGVSVTRAQVLKRLQSSGGSGEPGEGNRDRFQYDSIESQLLYEGIFERVTRDVTAPSPAQLAARRNERMARYVARLQRTTQVRYEPGYAPSP
jgi:SurA N-terminal domain